jgi:hypothetical protein
MPYCIYILYYSIAGKLGYYLEHRERKECSMYNYYLLILCWLWSWSVAAALDETVKNNLNYFFHHYQRPITVFEFSGPSQVYTPEVAAWRDVDATVVIVLMGKNITEEVMDRIKGTLDRVIILKPPSVGNHMLYTLSKCEHPDVVLVHDIPTDVPPLEGDFIRLLLCIGDYLGVDIRPDKVAFFNAHYKNHKLLIKITPHANGDDGFFAFFKTNKKGIIAPRWDEAVNDDSGIIYYPVISSFTDKTMYKTVRHGSKSKVVATPWHKGITLTTFVMMYGQRPGDGVILQSLQRLSKTAHNDLVMSNVLIQGDALQPIDFNDPRRYKAQSICLDTLIEAFSGDRLSFDHPFYFVDWYRRQLSL